MSSIYNRGSGFVVVPREVLSKGMHLHVICGHHSHCIRLTLGDFSFPEYLGVGTKA